MKPAAAVIAAAAFAWSGGALAGPCDAPNGNLGLGVDQGACAAWMRPPDLRGAYLSLDFRFDLAADLTAGAATRSFREWVTRLGASDQSFALKIAPTVGGVELPERVLFSYDLTQSGSQAVSRTDPAFFTPFVLADGRTLEFRLTLTASATPSLRAEDLTGDLASLMSLGDPATLLLSQSGKEVARTAARFSDSVLARFFGQRNLAEVRLTMAHPGAAGAARRELALTAPGAQPLRLGTLLVQVAVKPSMANPNLWYHGDQADAVDLPAPQDAEGVLLLTLPTGLGGGQSLLAALRADEGTFAHLSTLARPNAPADDLRGACRGLQDALRGDYALTADDALRATGALLRRANRLDALRRGDPTCFGREDWRAILERRLFEPFDPGDDWADVARAAELFATGLRVGFDGEAGRWLGATVEIEDPAGVLGDPACRGVLPRAQARACLTAMGLNRHDAPTPSARRGPGWAVLHMTRRADVAQALASLKGAPLPAEAAAALAALADPADAARVADALPTFHQVEIEVDTLATPAQATRVVLTPIARAEMAEQVMSLSEIKALAYSCWARPDGRGGDFCVRDGVAPPPG